MLFIKYISVLKGLILTHACSYVNILLYDTQSLNSFCCSLNFIFNDSLIRIHYFNYNDTLGSSFLAIFDVHENPNWLAFV